MKGFFFFLLFLRFPKDLFPVVQESRTEIRLYHPSKKQADKPPAVFYRNVLIIASVPISIQHTHTPSMVSIPGPAKLILILGPLTLLDCLSRHDVSFLLLPFRPTQLPASSPERLTRTTHIYQYYIAVTCPLFPRWPHPPWPALLVSFTEWSPLALTLLTENHLSLLNDLKHLELCLP